LTTENEHLVDIDDIISRVRSYLKIKSDRQVAEVLGISKENFSNRKRRGSLMPLFIEWGIKEGVNLQWLITGETFDSGDIYPVEMKLDVDQVLQQTRQILEGDDDEASIALITIIDRFSRELLPPKTERQNEIDVEEMEAELRRMQEDIARIKEGLAGARKGRNS